MAFRSGQRVHQQERSHGLIVTPENGYWTIYFTNDQLVFKDYPDLRLPLRAELQKVGVFVDYDEGLVSFYDVEARVHIYSATGSTFREPLYPFTPIWLLSVYSIDVISTHQSHLYGLVGAY